MLNGHNAHAQSPTHTNQNGLLSFADNNGDLSPIHNGHARLVCNILYVCHWCSAVDCEVDSLDSTTTARIWLFCYQRWQKVASAAHTLGVEKNFYHFSFALLISFCKQTNKFHWLFKFIYAHYNKYTRSTANSLVSVAHWIFSVFFCFIFFYNLYKLPSNLTSKTTRT